MDAQELRNLQEAYMEVYDEGFKRFPYKKVEDKIHKKEADNPTGRGTSQSVKMDKVFRHFKGGDEVRRTEKREHSPQISKAKSAENRARGTQKEQADLYDNIPSHLLDEAERPIYGRGGKLRRTETPLEVLGKHATARDKKTKHNIPRGGRTFPAGKPEEGDPSSLSSGEYDRGKGSKAARRAAALKKPEPKKSFPNRLRRSDGQGIRDSYDYYDIILSHLLDEGYAETPEAAEAIMVNMSEEWRESIIG